MPRYVVHTHTGDGRDEHYARSALRRELNLEEAGVDADSTWTSRPLPTSMNSLLRVPSPLVLARQHARQETLRR